MVQMLSFAETDGVLQQAPLVTVQVNTFEEALVIVQMTDNALWLHNPSLCAPFQVSFQVSLLFPADCLAVATCPCDFTLFPLLLHQRRRRRRGGEERKRLSVSPQP